MRLLLVLFILCPLLELWLLLKVGTWLGALPTVALVVLSALLGMALLRRVGWQMLSSTQLRMRQHGSPVPALFEGFMLTLAGVLLLLPGLISDGIALLLLIAPLRRWLLARWGRMAMAASHTAGPGVRPPPDVIEGEYRREP
jgi:UPF0716 protein FxsA